jgi:hypothetical protein
MMTMKLNGFFVASRRRSMYTAICAVQDLVPIVSSAWQVVSSVGAFGSSGSESRISGLIFTWEMSKSSNGGFASKLPSVGRKEKNDPTEPNGASVAGCAEQKRGHRQFIGDAKHSMEQPKCCLRTSKHSPWIAAWNPPAL